MLSFTQRLDALRAAKLAQTQEKQQLIGSMDHDDWALVLPPEAWAEYGFQPGEEAAFLPGSRTSGGFGLSTPRLLAQAAGPLRSRCLALGRISDDGRIEVPSAVGVQPGSRLLVVRGSGRALGFVARGPIYEEALRHPELETPRLPSHRK